MKKLYSFIIALVTITTLMGQAPESFKYQAVLRNARGDIKASSAAVIGIDILKGSATGLRVYSETHNVTTDRYGLINLEIGKGTSTLGTFSSVDWSTGSYYIKLLVDGIEMGTSQLLSVPYALYAKKSGNEISNFDFTGSAPNDILQFNGTKWVKFTPDFALNSHTHADATTTVSGFMSGTDKTKLNGLQNANGSETIVIAGTTGIVTVAGTGTTTDPYIIDAAADGSGTIVTAGTSGTVTVTGTGTSTDPYLIDATAHYIGESYGGGIVFYVYDNGRHGLIAAAEDILNSAGIPLYLTWCNVWYSPYQNEDLIYTGTTGDGLGAGAMNTALIVSGQISYTYSNGSSLNDFAAKKCADYEVTEVINDLGDEIIYGDWYLPSKYELNLLYFQKDLFGNFIDDYYWSSTEYDDYDAWYQDFYNGSQDSFYDGPSKPLDCAVRAIRAF
jgi:hypothetical protein